MFLSVIKTNIRPDVFSFLKDSQQICPIAAAHFTLTDICEIWAARPESNVAQKRLKKLSLHFVVFYSAVGAVFFDTGIMYTWSLRLGVRAFKVRMKSLNAVTSTESKKPTEHNIRQVEVVSVEKSCSSPKSLSFSHSLICNEGNHSNKTLIIELHFGYCCQH